MTEATRQALEHVSQILHDAGWDARGVEPRELTEQTLLAMRHAYTNLLRDDYLAIIQETLGKGQRVEDAGRALGKEPEEAKALLSEALTRLVDFAEIAEEQGFVTPAGVPSRMGSKPSTAGIE
jgi:hypothetical protein